MGSLHILDTTVRVAVAALCGAALGWEREVKDKPAGLRTNILVALGAATATMAALELHVQLGNDGSQSSGTDPIRIVSGVIGGLGFLGAGSIIQARGHVAGMTTAATIWVVGAVGVACGMAYYTLAVVSSVAAFVVLFVIGRFEHSNLAPESVRKKTYESAGDRVPEDTALGNS